jgi:DNA-binding XRE family transcriptional regulator
MSKGYESINNREVNQNLMIEKERLSMWLVANRNKKKLTQGDLATYARVSQRVICQIETRTVDPQLHTIARLATFFGANFCDIFNDGRPTREQSQHDYQELRTLRQSTRT